MKTKQEKETEKRIVFLVANLSWLALLLGEARAPWAPWLCLEPITGTRDPFEAHRSLKLKPPADGRFLKFFRKKLAFQH